MSSIKKGGRPLLPEHYFNPDNMQGYFPLKDLIISDPLYKPFGSNYIDSQNNTIGGNLFPKVGGARTQKKSRCVPNSNNKDHNSNKGRHKSKRNNRRRRRSNGKK